jgi:hypothetical protein
MKMGKKRKLQLAKQGNVRNDKSKQKEEDVKIERWERAVRGE